MHRARPARPRRPARLQAPCPARRRGNSRLLRPRTGASFLTGLTSPVPGCTSPDGHRGLDLAAAGWAPPAASWWCLRPRPTPLPVVFASTARSGPASDLRDAVPARAAVDGGAIFVYPMRSRAPGTWPPSVRTDAGGPADRQARPELLHRSGAASTSPASAPARSSPSTSGATCPRRLPASPWWRGATLGSTPAAARSPCRASSSTAPTTRRSRSKRDAPRARAWPPAMTAPRPPRRTARTASPTPVRLPGRWTAASGTGTTPSRTGRGRRCAASSRSRRSGAQAAGTATGRASTRGHSVGTRRPSGTRARSVGVHPRAAKAFFQAAKLPPARQASIAARPASGPHCASMYSTQAQRAEVGRTSACPWSPRRSCSRRCRRPPGCRRRARRRAACSAWPRTATTPSATGRIRATARA